MSLSDENSNAGFLSSTPSPLGEETKDGGDGKAESNGKGAESFSFTVKNGPRIEDADFARCPQPCA